MGRLMQQAVHHPSKDKGHRGDRGKSAAGEYALLGEVGTCRHAISQAEPRHGVYRLSHHL